MKIKICGLKRIEDIKYVNKAMPDYAGFVFAGQKRKIDYDTAVSLKEKLDKGITPVGVFVNENIDFIIRLVEAGIIDMVQLHGDEDEEYIHTLRKKLMDIGRLEEIPIMKGVRVKTTKQIQDAEKLKVDFLLLDAFQENEYGGSGVRFNHDLIPGLTNPYFLAGGITAENVRMILQTLKEKNHLPYCIDVSSSVETDGYKDEEKIQNMVRLVHTW